MKILVLTVGGSPPPLITSIRQSKPDKLFFLCSEDSPPSTKGSYIMVEEILKKAGRDMSHCEIVKISRFDDFNDCYTTALRLLEMARQEHPQAEIIADYSGGTKSMTAGLAAAALDCPGVVMGVVVGDRLDLTKVSNGTHSLHLSRAHRAILERQKRAVMSSYQRFDYAAAASLLESMLQIPDLPGAESQLLQQWLVLARALDSWDKFDHATAENLLYPRKKEYQKLVMFLQACLCSRRKLEPKFQEISLPGIREPERGHGYELIEDLYLNAQRRAFQGRYDDAVARLYRALELLAQARLMMGYGINTSDVNLEQLPESLRPKYEGKAGANRKIQLPLVAAFELLLDFSQLQNEPLGTHYQAHRQELLDFLGIRNSSILAHRITPVAQGDYKKARLFFESFLDGAFSQLSQAGKLAKSYATRLQFPQSPPGILVSE